VPGRCEIIPPRELVEARPARGGYLLRAVARARVHHHGFVHKAADRGEATVEELLLVLDDETRRKEHRTLDGRRGAEFRRCDWVRAPDLTTRFAHPSRLWVRKSLPTQDDPVSPARHHRARVRWGEDHSGRSPDR